VTALVVGDPRVRALPLLRAHGRDTVAAQILEPGFRYWFDGDAVVAFVEVGRAWVAAGGPIAAPARVAEVARGFVAAAASSRRRACFFAAEQGLLDALALPTIAIGEQPVWDAARWDEVVRGSASLRYQVRRARHKGVTVRQVDERALTVTERLAIDGLLARWRAAHRMAPMRFLVQLAPLAPSSERRLLIAERGGAPIGLLSAVPVHARGRLFIEDLVRDPAAPNGTVEGLVDQAMRDAAAAGYREVTLGLAPLTGDVPRWLRMVRRVASPLYDFDGLRAFKAKLRPHHWEPVYLCASPGGSTLAAVRDSLRAFAGGSLVGFGWRTLRH
jgi:lysylphosphatidylglycerol synthetase-like protein (DUF2156 family)